MLRKLRLRQKSGFLIKIKRENLEVNIQKRKNYCIH